MKRQKVETIEILSPAKNFEYAKAAILCGADAIYAGSPKFGMRSHAANSMEDIQKMIEFAHKYWAKVYITVNCLLFTKEDIKEAEGLINQLYAMGVDGIIIQDLGILELNLPPVPIILSTTVRCNSKEDALFFEKCGIDRIVLTRELSFDEIKDITLNSNIKIEVFAYGFLCSGYNGNCYLTYVENLKRTKSSNIAHYQAANHGVCFARCMDSWTLRDADNNIIRENDRLLNLKFLDLHKEIGKFIDIGIDSFKIEGRERDLKYTKNATAILSDAANKVIKEKNIKRCSSGKTILSFEFGKYNSFNKGFTDYFLYGRKKEMYSKYDIVGESVGTIIDFDYKSFTLNSDIQLNIGDKLRYKTCNNPVQVMEIIDKKDNRYYIKPINDDIKGLELFRYINTKKFSEVENSVNYRVISVSLFIQEENGNYIIKAIDEDDNKAEVIYQKGSQNINQKDLYNLDEDCEFIIDKMTSATNPVSIYIDNIEKFRNAIFTELRKEREKNRPKYTAQVIKSNEPYYKKELTYLANVTNEYTKSFWQRHGVEKIEAGFETYDDIKNKKAFSGKYCIRYELGMCSKNCTKEIPPLPWTIEQVKSGNRYEIEFDCKNCSMYFYNIE